MLYFVVCVIGYLFGCVQTSYLVGKLILKKDIREMGNGNAGASNATVVFGKGFGLLTAFVDIMKGFLALMLIRGLYGSSQPPDSLLALLHLGGLFVVLGHNYPFYMNFRGGKGTAALVGVLFGMNWQVGLIGLVAIIVVSLMTDYIVLGTMALLVVLLGNALLFHLQPLVFIADVTIVAMSVYKHRLNLYRIRLGEEKSVRKELFKKS